VSKAIGLTAVDRMGEECYYGIITKAIKLKKKLMIKILDKNMPFIAQMINATLTGMTFLVGFSRVTRSYEMSLVYVAGLYCCRFCLYYVGDVEGF